MPDSKITALASIGTGTDPAVDPLVIVDVSDTTMAASGTTKKVTLNNLLACSPTATLASATITGNLTLSAGTANGVGYLNASKVFTAGSALVFDGTNLGVGGTGQLRFATSGGAIGDNSIGTENSFSMMLRCGRGSTSNIELASDKLVFGVAATEQMRLNSTGLGVGVSPAYKLDVAGSSAGVLRLVNINNSSTDPAAVTRLSLDSQGATWHLDNERTNGIFKIIRNSTTFFTIDNSGNLILQPSAAPATLTTNGQLTVNATSNTNLRFSYRGSDGVTRVADITLA